MYLRGLLLRSLLIGATAVGGLLLGLFLTGSLEMAFSPSPAIANAPQQEAPAMLDETQAVHDCNIADVAVTPPRIQVHCWNGVGNIIFFATPTSNSAQSGRILSLLLTASAAGKRLKIHYEPTADGSSFGCDVSNCRPIVWVFMLD